MICFRAQWLTKCENPTKIFCSLENRNYLYKTIKTICSQSYKKLSQIENKYEELERYYSKLFQNHNNELQSVNLFADQDLT